MPLVQKASDQSRFEVNRRDPRCLTSLQGAEIWSGGLLQERGGEVLAEVDGGAHHGVAQVCHPATVVRAGPWPRDRAGACV